MAWKNYHVYYIWYNKYHIWCNTSPQKAKRLCCLLNTSLSRTYYLLILKFHEFLKNSFYFLLVSLIWKIVATKNIFWERCYFSRQLTGETEDLWQVWIWYPGELALQLCETKRHRGRKEKQWEGKVRSKGKEFLCTDKKWTGALATFPKTLSSLCYSKVRVW